MATRFRHLDLVGVEWRPWASGGYENSKLGSLSRVISSVCTRANRGAINFSRGTMDGYKVWIMIEGPRDKVAVGAL